MAIVTVSNAGGNYNVGATWVGGVVPLTTDTIAFTATSGNLTINVVSTCAGINFSNYVGTITINTTFRINGNINFGTGGYLVGGGNTMYAAATGTITSNGTAWKGHFGFTGTSQTYTLADDLTVNGTITCFVTTSGTLNGFTIYVKSTYSHISTGNLIGTTNLVFNGTGVWSHTSSGQLGLNTTINTSGTITCDANVRYNTGILTYTAGTIITTSSTLTIGGACTLDTSGMNWYNVAAQSSTITLNSTFTIDNNLTIGIVGSVVFSGTGSFSCANLSFTASGRTLTLKNALTYTVTTSLVFANVTILSSNASYSFLNLQFGASQNVTSTNATWINSSGGQSINTNIGTLNNTVNWNISSGNFLLMF